MSYNANKLRSQSTLARTRARMLPAALLPPQTPSSPTCDPARQTGWGSTVRTLDELNPGLVQSHVTAYGWDGPYSHRPGVDPIAQAITGLQHAQGGYDNPPVYSACSLRATTQEARLGALGTVLGLVARERLGVAQRVNTSLLAAGALMCVDGFMQYESMTPRPLPDSVQYGISPMRRVYSASDGWIAVAADSAVSGLPWLSSSEQAEPRHR